MLDSELTCLDLFFKNTIYLTQINSMLRNVIVKLMHLNLNIDKKHWYVNNPFWMASLHRWRTVYSLVSFSSLRRGWKNPSGTTRSKVLWESKTNATINHSVSEPKHLISFNINDARIHQYILNYDHGLIKDQFKTLIKMVTFNWTSSAYSWFLRNSN